MNTKQKKALILFEDSGMWSELKYLASHYSQLSEYDHFRFKILHHLYSLVILINIDQDDPSIEGLNHLYLIKYNILKMRNACKDFLVKIENFNKLGSNEIWEFIPKKYHHYLLDIFDSMNIDENIEDI